MFSVVILTLNEERNLARCLESVRACDDIVVLDSGSTDQTLAIAESFGARIFSRRFDDFAGQRNHAQRAIPFKHPWLFHLDADEQMTPALLAECERVVTANPGSVDGWWVAPRMIFEGRWIRHCTDYPAYQARFVRVPEFEFVQVGHGQREAPHMRMDRLKANYLHDLSSEDEAAWMAKHRRYAVAEAAEQRRLAGRRHWRQLFDHSPLIRRRALKHLSHHLPFRPTARFIYQYVLRGGWLDGRPGLRYCLRLRCYEQFVADALRT
jgi:glycosyltransferase involved in cell wall biosynthesis